jgi:hypothetical protein
MLTAMLTGGYEANSSGAVPQTNTNNMPYMMEQHMMPGGPINNGYGTHPMIKGSQMIAPLNGGATVVNKLPHGVAPTSMSSSEEYPPAKRQRTQVSYSGQSDEPEKSSPPRKNKRVAKSKRDSVEHDEDEDNEHSGSDDAENAEPPAQPSIPPVEKLNNNHYLYRLRTVENKLKTMRMRIMQNDLNGIEQEQQELRNELETYLDEFDQLVNSQFLLAKDMKTLQSLEEFIETYLLPQIALYEMDVEQLRHPMMLPTREVPVYLGVVQEQAGPIFKDKPIGPFTIRLLTGATVQQVHSGPIQPELYESSQRIKRNNADLENAKQVFNENGVAVFNDLKFQSGTFPNLVRIKFRVVLQVVIDNQTITRTIESVASKPFISMTNTGSQWKDAAGAWLKEDCFKDSFEITIQRFWNYFQKHFLMSTKQDISNIRRPLYITDFDYMIKAKFKKPFAEKKMLNQKEYEKFWDWVGPALKKVRYQKYLLWLFENGFLCAFVTGPEAEEQLINESNGTFMIRMSERLDGEFVISYKWQGSVRHYLIQPDDTADKKKTLVDFLGLNPSLSHLLQMKTDVNEKRIYFKHNKDKLLAKHYKKPPKQSAKNQSLGAKPYDSQMM